MCYSRSRILAREGKYSGQTGPKISNQIGLETISYHCSFRSNWGCLGEYEMGGTLSMESKEKSMLAMGREGRQATLPNESSTQLNI